MGSFKGTLNLWGRISLASRGSMIRCDNLPLGLPKP